MLIWGNPKEIVEKGKQFASKVNDLSLLIMPAFRPCIWDPCAEVLSMKTDDELSPYFEDLFQWIHDLNWPGALTIYERLLEICPENALLRDALINCFKRSTEKNDLRWRGWLQEFYNDYCKKNSINPEAFIGKRIITDETK